MHPLSTGACTRHYEKCKLLNGIATLADVSESIRTPAFRCLMDLRNPESAKSGSIDFRSWIPLVCHSLQMRALPPWLESTSDLRNHLFDEKVTKPEVPPWYRHKNSPKQAIQAKEHRRMDQIVPGSMIQPYFDLSTKIEPKETAARLEPLRVLRNAIHQHRRLLESRHDYVPKLN